MEILHSEILLNYFQWQDCIQIKLYCMVKWILMVRFYCLVKIDCIMRFTYFLWWYSIHLVVKMFTFKLHKMFGATLLRRLNLLFCPIQILLNGTFFVSFSFILSHQFGCLMQVVMPMIGFELQICGKGSNRSTNCATTTAHSKSFLIKTLLL